ncbi:MAG: sporulation integral membrane protein YtvI [Clostridia bacterium]|nr:sporulation integral membrane protein YtvI [Clostridia bacterium]
MKKMQNERLEKRKEFIINTAYIALLAVLVFLCFKYAAKWLMPFIVGFVIAASVNAPVKRICKATKLNRKFCAIVFLLIEYALIVLVIWVLGAKIVDSLKELFSNLPVYYDQGIEPFLANCYRWISDMTARISPDTLDQIYQIFESTVDSLRDFILNLSASMGKGLASFTAKLPFYFISFVFTILASIFISIDYSNITTFLKNQLPAKFAGFLGDAKSHLGKTILRYIRAYLIIWIITFTELSIGLSILKIDSAIGLAALIAVADILPVIGTGGALIPWAIFSLFSQNYFVGLGLIILYIVVLVVRNFAEPKIVGDQLGLNPLVTLIAIYLGYLWMGVWGMILLPITATILIGLHKTGKIKMWKE